MARHWFLGEDGCSTVGAQENKPEVWHALGLSQLLIVDILPGATEAVELIVVTGLLIR